MYACIWIMQINFECLTADLVQANPPPENENIVTPQPENEDVNPDDEWLPPPDD